MLLMQGVPLKAVSKRLGHTLASTTSDIYGHSLRSVEDIAADKLEAMLSPSSQLKRRMNKITGEVRSLSGIFIFRVITAVPYKFKQPSTPV